tara:strand:- start:159 stop:422 length:264 start_codon:yes stop_codon:yes gene_type:complete
MILQKSSRKDKKFQVKYNNRVIHFGAKGMSDYTINKDPKRKALYLKRHRAREDWTNPNTAGYWSRWILWNKPTTPQDNFKDIKKRFK